ncbi:hypothetical protein LIER_30609 [Lithospermum erythrorhizon]|uniref:Reverse transcriptase n=1 Tax=Lithospermum erythrorhizon TaxID=34254 RepID=A0AAV3RN89_LITER
MLRDVEMRKGLRGIKIRRDGPNINYILFADVTMIFCKPNKDEGNEVMRILHDYEVVPGQRVNLSKCSVSFDYSTPATIKSSMVSILRMREVKDHGKYLGLPPYIGRSKGWQGKFMSQAGK